MTLKVATTFGLSRVSREDGARLRREIQHRWSTEQPLELDFENARIASVSFLDEGIAILALEHPLEEIRRRLRVANMTDLDRRMLNNLLQARAAQRQASLREHRAGKSRTGAPPEKRRPEHERSQPPRDRSVTLYRASTRMGYAADALDGVQLRLDDALAEAALRTKPAFALLAVPRGPVEVPSLLQDDSHLVRTIGNPPRIRTDGFGVAALHRTQLVRAKLRRGLLRGHCIIEVWRDGTVLFAAEASDALCWGPRGPSDRLRVNPLQLSETVYSFVELTQSVFAHATERTGAAYALSLRNMIQGEQRAELSPGPIGTLSAQFGMNVRSAPEADADWMVLSDEPAVPPGLIAYRLIREVYSWFGIGEEGIPYVATHWTGESAIDPNLIRSRYGEPPHR